MSQGAVVRCYESSRNGGVREGVREAPFSHPSFADLSSTLPLLLIMTIILNTLVLHYSHPASFKVIKYFYCKKKKFLEGEQLQSLFDTSEQQSSHTKKNPKPTHLIIFVLE